MGYCEDMREMIGNSPLIFVRPSIALINKKAEILLSRNLGGTWTIPGGVLQLNESVEECVTRIVLEDLGVKIHKLKLFGVYSGKELINRIEENGNEYQPVAIVYLCTEYEGEIIPNYDQRTEAQFFRINDLPEEMNPFIKNKLVELVYKGFRLLQQR
jgi:ADP-ribose pyrophosphatase YjhB (NUDIX family)